MAKSDETAKSLLDSINSAESEELKEKAKLEAKEYVESFNDTESEEHQEPQEPVVTDSEPEHVDPVSEVETAENELTVEIDVEEPVGERPEPQPPVNSALIAKIRRRQKLAEENAKRRQNQPTTLKEQKEWAKERAAQLMERNKLMTERRAELRKLIEKQQEEARKNNQKNMMGLLTILLRELHLNIRLEVICKNHNITRQDLEKLKTNNPSGWAQCLAERPKLEKEMDMYIK